VNVLDENIPHKQKSLLRRERGSFHQIGEEIGRKTTQDEDIVPLLHRLDRPTLFTQDQDFYDRRLCHERYCLVYLDVDENRVAEYIRRILRHRMFKTKANRMGCVIRAHSTGVAFWRLHDQHERRLLW